MVFPVLNGGPGATLILLICACQSLPTLFPCSHPTSSLKLLRGERSVTEPRWGEGLLQAAPGLQHLSQMLLSAAKWDSTAEPNDLIYSMPFFSCSNTSMEDWWSGSVYSSAVTVLSCLSEMKNAVWGFIAPGGEIVFSIGCCLPEIWVCFYKDLSNWSIELSQSWLCFYTTQKKRENLDQ